MSKGTEKKTTRSNIGGRIFAGLLAVVLVAVLGGVVWLVLRSAPREATGRPNHLVLAPTAGKPGDLLTVQGQGYKPNEQVNIYWADGKDITCTGCHAFPRSYATADAQGNFAAAAFNIPWEASSGQHAVSAVGIKSSISETLRFAVAQWSPSLHLKEGEAKVGNTLHVDVTGFAGDEVIYLYWDQTKPAPGSTPDGKLRTNGDGNGSGTMTIVAGKKEGPHTISGQGQKSLAIATANLTVQ